MEYALKYFPFKLDLEIKRPEDIVGLKFVKKQQTLDKEVLTVIHLNSNLEIRGYHIAAIGGKQSCSFNTADVLKEIIVRRTSAFIMVHNHPDEKKAKPTKEDFSSTLDLAKVAYSARIPMIDHIVLAEGGDWYSFQRNRKVFPAGMMYLFQGGESYVVKRRKRKSRRRSKDKILRMIAKVNTDFTIR